MRDRVDLSQQHGAPSPNDGDSQKSKESANRTQQQAQRSGAIKQLAAIQQWM